MLSKNHQLFLMESLIGRNTKKTQHAYKSAAFYRSINYLKKNDLIKTKKGMVKKGNGMFCLENIYVLTIKGSLLARTLAGLTSTPDEFKKKAIV